MRIFVLIRAQGVEYDKIGHIILKYQKRGWKLLNLKEKIPTPEFLKLYYSKYNERKEYKRVMNDSSIQRVIGLEFEKSYGTIEGARKIMTHLRKLYFCNTHETIILDNFVDCSESKEDANRSIHLWFNSFLLELMDSDSFLPIRL